ncbi:hypothetical protein EDD85DRAFT_796600 [Armillaria nabsnona]|nr:hypothetical protein EDD85DRAFT_796600 [Armillaria nabsnona]
MTIIMTRNTARETENVHGSYTDWDCEQYEDGSTLDDEWACFSWSDDPKPSISAHYRTALGRSSKKPERSIHPSEEVIGKNGKKTCLRLKLYLVARIIVTQSYPIFAVGKKVTSEDENWGFLVCEQFRRGKLVEYTIHPIQKGGSVSTRQMEKEIAEPLCHKCMEEPGIDSAHRLPQIRRHKQVILRLDDLSPWHGRGSPTEIIIGSHMHYHTRPCKKVAPSLRTDNPTAESLIKKADKTHHWDAAAVRDAQPKYIFIDTLSGRLSGSTTTMTGHSYPKHELPMSHHAVSPKVAAGVSNSRRLRVRECPHPVQSSPMAASTELVRTNLEYLHTRCAKGYYSQSDMGAANDYSMSGEIWKTLSSRASRDGRIRARKRAEPLRKQIRKELARMVALIEKGNAEIIFSSLPQKVDLGISLLMDRGIEPRMSHSSGLRHSTNDWICGPYLQDKTQIIFCHISSKSAQHWHSKNTPFDYTISTPDGDRKSDPKGEVIAEISIIFIVHDLKRFGTKRDGVARQTRRKYETAHD